MANNRSQSHSVHERLDSENNALVHEFEPIRSSQFSNTWAELEQAWTLSEARKVDF